MMGVVGKVLLIALAIVIPGGIPAYLIYLSGKRIKEKNVRGSELVERHSEKPTGRDDTVQNICG